MREIRPSSLEGGTTFDSSFLPLSLSGVGCWDSPCAVGRGRALRVGSALPALRKRLRSSTTNLGMHPESHGGDALENLFDRKFVRR